MMATLTTSPPLPILTDPLSVALSPSHSAQIRAQALRRNLTSSTSAPHLLRFHNNLIRTSTSLSLPSLSFSLLLSLLHSSLLPNQFTFPFLFKSCSLSSDLPLGLQLHAHLAKSSAAANLFCDSALLDLYVKAGSLGDALKVFERMPERSVPTWNSMVSGLARNGLVLEALEVLGLMEILDLDVGSGSWNSVVAGCVSLGDVGLVLEVLVLMVSSLVRPDSSTFNTVLPVIPDIEDLGVLRELHGFVVRNLTVDSVGEDRMWSAIAAAYASSGDIGSALRLFKRVKLRNAQLGNSMISGFLNCGQSEEAFSVFRGMAVDCIQEAMILSKVSLTLLLPKCSRELRTGLEIHAYAVRRGLESDMSVGNALMAMYSKRGDRKSMEIVFRRTVDKDVVSWNTVVASYALAHDFDCAFELFQQMLDEGVKPDEFSFSSVLHGCGHSSYLRQGMALHGHVLKSGFLHSCLVVQNSLIDAYGKCGCVVDAHKVFSEMDWRDIISWNTIISCYGFSASPEEAISLFERMIAVGLKPNRVTFIALLSACSHAGNLEKGLHYFESMVKEHGIAPDLEHYVCMVDNMGRTGHLERAYQFIKDMPIKPDDCIWSSLLSSCRIHGNVELAEIAARNLIVLEPGHSGYWVLLSNVYADALRWRDVSNIRSTMKDGGVKKNPGYSWIEVGGSEVHKFLTADKLHKQCDDIYFAIDGLTSQLKDEGYIPSLDS